jgi:hypothetical protein
VYSDEDIARVVQLAKKALRKWKGGTEPTTRKRAALPKPGAKKVAAKAPTKASPKTSDKKPTKAPAKAPKKAPAKATGKVASKTVSKAGTARRLTKTAKPARAPA